MADFQPVEDAGDAIISLISPPGTPTPVSNELQAERKGNKECVISKENESSYNDNDDDDGNDDVSDNESDDESDDSDDDAEQNKLILGGELSTSAYAVIAGIKYVSSC